MKSRLLHFMLILNALFFAGASYAQTISISASPGDTVCFGTSVVFTSTVTPSGSYGYIWKLNGAAAGATTSTYTAGTSLITGDKVFCVLTNLAGDTVKAISDTITMTIDSLPVVMPITGLDSVCTGGTLHLSDATPGGVWSSTNPAAATINSTTGVVTGIAPTFGTLRMVYKMTNGCGSDSVRFRIRINIPPGPITGPTSLCMDSTTFYRDTTRGTWSTTDTTIAKFINQFGQLTALAPGNITVQLSVANACGSFNETLPLQILNCDSQSIVPAIMPLSKAVSIFPNPNTGTCFISLGGNYATANCVISNIIGEKIKEIAISQGKQTEVSIGRQAGIYFITVTAGNERYTTKIIVTQ